MRIQKSKIFNKKIFWDKFLKRTVKVAELQALLARSLFKVILRAGHGWFTWTRLTSMTIMEHRTLGAWVRF